jgi:sulfur-carrier protein
MKLTLKYFGQIAELMHKSTEELHITAPLKVADLQKLKEMEYPELTKSDYRIAVNQVLADSTFEINTPAEIAFLPPFAGG